MSAIKLLNTDEDIRVAPNFTLPELVKSSTAERMGISNMPDSAQILVNLVNVANHILQPARDEFGPLRVNSGYRGLALNKAVGGSKTSQHCFGEAADFESSRIGNYKLACWVRDNLDFDQLILEFYTQGEPSSGWVHCSYKTNGQNRKKINTALRIKGKTVYKPGLIQ
ncbi:MAG: peptidase M15A [Acidimicrobiaceae bacterium]|jgi:hypothetical protein|nr:peptidase M15A [Acidimicrobiaceae bacterium]|tara:strand:+ start:10165 stop:10668 length:504 start_codon:yes stop_codon:yes gene_type:complete